MPEDSRVGVVLASKYRLEELLGSGGMGHVYRAVNVEIERAVAIKVLRSEHATNAQLVERFLREARAANLVRHPNVVDVVDIGRDRDGSPFIVQELLRGEDLSKFVERRGGKLTMRDIEEYLLPVIDAVAEAHAQGVVHRDLKPENVFLADQGRRRVPKLLDFGISKMRAPITKLTDVGTMMGTPAYMAPEQVQGARDADPRADVWALGVTLFELIAGRMPFDAQDAPALFYAIATKDVPRLVDVCPEVAADLSMIVARCLRREPEQRYPSALELARDLRHFFDGEEPEATNPSLSLSAIPDLPLPRPPAADMASSKTDVGPPPTRPERATVREVPALRPPSSPELAAPPSHRQLTPESLPGVMLAGPPMSTPRRMVPSAGALPRPQPAASEGLDLSFLVALTVVGVTVIIVMSVLTTVATRADGWPIVGIFTKPTPAVNLIAQGGLGALTFFFAARSARDGTRKWRSEMTGSRGAAFVSAIIAGGLFYATLQLVRAAW